MKITAIKVESVSMRVNPAFAIVSAAGTHPESHYLVVTVHTDTDAVGYGEATLAPVWSGETQNGAAFAIDAILAPMLVGKDPRNVRALSAAMDRGLIGNPFTKAAVEMALLDTAARSYRISVSMLLGGSRREAGIPLKFSIGAFSPAEAARVAAHAIGLGLHSVKVKVGLDVRTDIERVAAVRAEIGDSVRIAVDAMQAGRETMPSARFPCRRNSASMHSNNRCAAANSVARHAFAPALAFRSCSTNRSSLSRM